MGVTEQVVVDGGSLRDGHAVGVEVCPYPDEPLTLKVPSVLGLGNTFVQGRSCGRKRSWSSHPLEASERS